MFRKTTPSPKRIPNVRRFCIYYELGTPKALQKLKSFDLAVLDPRQWSSAALLELKRSGTLLFGYLSVMETPSWDGSRSARILPSDLLLIDGQPRRFPEWDSVLMDLRSARYRSLLLEEIGHMAEASLWDGIFLDTVGDIEDYVPADLQEDMATAYRMLLAVAARRFPGLLWMQNRGFAQLEGCAEWLDGFLWEGWDGAGPYNPWLEKWTSRLADRQRQGLTVLAVSADPSPVHRQTAEKLGYVHGTSRGSHYNQLPEG